MAELPASPERWTRVALVGGWLVILGCVLTVVSVAIGSIGQPATIGSAGLGGVVLILALSALAGGFATLAIAGPRQVGGRAVRTGLGLLAIGIAGLLVGSIVASGLSYDPLEEASVVIPFFTGALALLVGVPVTIVALLVQGGSARRLATLFLGGFAVVFAAGLLSSAMLANDPSASSAPLGPTVIAIAGLGLMLVAVGGLGMLAIRSEQGGTPVVA